MPRKSRLDMPGALHHLIIRGIERKKIFRDIQDRENFLIRLGRILAETKTACYAWALLPNHVHLLLRTGELPLADVMRRLLTGYAVSFNRKYRRHGPLFQNRYKSILCQEDTYFLELVRYIHLNPLRVGDVNDYESLGNWPYAGHSVILGNRKNSWQDIGYVLGYFGRRKKIARGRYRDFVQEGICLGKRPELVGGGLRRSLGGWKEVGREMVGGIRLKGDERILGNSDFVLEVLRVAEEKMERGYRLRAAGYNLDRLAQKVAKIFGVRAEDLWIMGKYARILPARSLFCYWAVRELGVSATEMARRLNLSQPAVSIAVKRGERIAKEKGLVMSLE
ncbi:MAG: transposase [Thermodesulfobacteriota bacterium]